MPISIAIDGPSGAGKSTIAKEVSKRLDALYLDTGAMYRSVGLHMHRRGISLTDIPAVEKELPNVDLRVRYENGSQHVYLGEEDVSQAIRMPEISAAASAVGAIPAVRKRMVDMQREIALGQDIIMDGRDIGTHVLPNASVKVFLTASAEIRAQRRFAQLKRKGIDQPFDEVLAEIIQRDINDSTRAASPLVQADDAVVLDSSDKDISACVQFILDLAAQARKEQAK